MTAAGSPGLYIGLMSGTSVDGVDGVLARFGDDAPAIRAAASRPIPPALRAELLALNRPGHDEIARMSQASLALADLYAQVVRALLDEAGVPAGQVRAIGAHGQTVRHRPDLGYTVQINAPARLAEACGIPVVADLRSRDVAAGGQGAPLVPAFHAAVFGQRGPCAIVNLGGIANVTLLEPGQPVRGFDTGPANMLLDAWCARHTGQPFDRDGHFAAAGRADAPLCDYLIAGEPWFAAAPPKSTGRDLFGEDWLDSRLAGWPAPLKPADVQATLLQLTARTVSDAVRAHGPGCQRLWICGGGAHNPALMRALAAASGLPVEATDALGVPAQQVEALAFAWLAQRHLAGLAGNLPAVTGASGERVLGALYPA
ncbi:anhydro-N-acetylmuramic acid kinase [Pigmentiphaga soli]|uniref:Anhydro-N-acetylmuramic acid kinase n=1 Tax=Pigmentiphaga soli TaxID=1007095 RepID=A0ABP8GTJ8_9BURK